MGAILPAAGWGPAGKNLANRTDLGSKRYSFSALR